MDLSAAVRALEGRGFTVTFQRNEIDPAQSKHIAISRDGWFATRVRLPVNGTPSVHVGVAAGREAGAFVFWRPSCMAVPTRYLALEAAFVFVDVVRYAQG
jgi:hypothetical protein